MLSYYVLSSTLNALFDLAAIRSATYIFFILYIFFKFRSSHLHVVLAAGHTSLYSRVFHALQPATTPPYFCLSVQTLAPWTYQFEHQKKRVIFSLTHPFFSSFFLSFFFYFFFFSPSSERKAIPGTKSCDTQHGGRATTTSCSKVP